MHMRGHIRSNRGWCAGFFGVLVGALLAAATAYLALRYFKRRSAQDFKETEIVDQPPQRVFGALQPTTTSEQYTSWGGAGVEQQ